MYYPAPWKRTGTGVFCHKRGTTPLSTSRTPPTDLSRSAELYREAQRFLVGGVNSPVRAFRAVGGEPVFVDRMQGPYVYDVDGRRYIDLVGSWGPAIVGHAHPNVVEAVKEAAERGLSFGACCSAEAELAAVIVGALPSVEMVRFVNSGTEATMSAIRLARAVTSRPKVLKFIGCYHGHADGLLVAAGSGAATFGVPDSAGVPETYARETLLAQFNDSASVEAAMSRHGSETAAIVVEPLAGNMGYVEAQDGFLVDLRAICDAHGALLIFDEVMTGFRVAWGGYQNLCSVQPDLTCLGKVIGGGMPVAAYGGPSALMKQVSPLGPAYQAGTLSGSPVGMAAGIATLEICRTDGFYEALGERSAKLARGFESAASRSGIEVQAGATGGMLGMAILDHPVRNFEDAKAANHVMFSTFFRAMLNRGIWLPPSGYEAMFLSAAHDGEAIDHVIDAAIDSFAASAE